MGCGSSASASEPGSGGASRSVGGGTQKGKNLFPDQVEFHYFGMNGRADPIR